MRALERLRGAGRTLREAARAIGASVRSAARWCRQWRLGHLRAVPLGRPAMAALAADRAAAEHELVTGGLRTGIPTLKAHHPAVARSELEELKRGLVAERNERRREHECRCRWHRAGAVWAMDFTELEGEPRTWVLVVRDLSGGMQLAHAVMARQNSRAVMRVLAGLFARYGAPLVLKCDNGSPLIAKRVRRLLKRRGVTLLRSPVRCPSYNGACEACVGSFKRWLEALWPEHPGLTTQELADEALRRMNETIAKRGARRCSADDVWVAREEITRAEREGFRQAVAEAKRQERKRRDAEEAPLPKGRARQKIERRAIRNALVANAYLSISKR